MAAAVACMYYAGAKVGLALTFMPFPLSVLWPPNALLLAALLLTPSRLWWLLVLASLPAHVLAELEARIPLEMVLGWFVSNTCEALIGALIFRRLSVTSPDFRTVHSVLVFCVAAVTAALLTSFLDAGLVRLVGWGDAGYWTLWRTRLFTNIVAALTFVPVVVTCVAALPSWIRHWREQRVLEAAALLAGLLAVGTVVFGADVVGLGSSPSLLYLPLPLLVWAALRFGPPMASLSFAIVAFLVIWGAGHGEGPFLNAVTHDGALPVQLFLITIAVPLMLLSALIDERRQAERRLRASQELFSTTFRADPHAIAVSRRSDGRLIEANDGWVRLFGKRPQPATAPRSDTESHDDDSGLALLTGLLRQAGDLRGAEMALRDCRGVLRNVLVWMTAVDLGREACAITIVQDITELRRAEEHADAQRQQITHLNRVASLTDFSSTLAHELNQPLTAILSNAQAALRLLARDVPDLAELRSILGDIADSDKRAGQLIHHLRMLVKKGPETFAPIDLNQVTHDALAFTHGVFISGGVEVATSLAPDLPRIDGDAVQLQQLLLNLVSNACDAMQGPIPRAKRLTVTTSRSADGMAQLVVADSGRGFAADQVERMFDAFHTTKVNGLGLGLSICRQIAEAHGGTLSAENREGGGANFRLALPVAGVADSR